MSASGVAGMSMRRLAAACNLQVGAIYHYFESKDALLAAVVAERQYRTRLAEPVPIDRRAPAPDRLGALFLHVWNGSLEEESIWRLLLGEGIRGEPAVLRAGRDLLGLVEAAAQRWVEEFLAELEQPDVVAELLVAQVFACFARLVFSPGRPSDRRRIAEHGADTLVAAVFGQEAAPIGGASYVGAEAFRRKARDTRALPRNE